VSNNIIDFSREITIIVVIKTFKRRRNVKFRTVQGCVVASLLLMTLAACERKSEVAPAGQEGTEMAPLPVVNYAEVLSNGFLSERPLILQFATAEGITREDLFRYRWYVDGAVVDGAAGTALEPQYFRKGSRVEAEITPSDGQRQGRPFRTAAVTIRNTPPVMTAATLKPAPAYAGDTITVAAEARDHDGDAVQFRHQWFVNNVAVAGGESGSFPTAGLKRKDAISAEVTPFDGEDKGQPMTTGFVVLANRTPDITSAPPSGLQNGVYSYQVQAKDPDGDKLSFSVVSGPQGMIIDPSTGLLRWQPQGVTGRQEMRVKIAVEDAEGAVAYQEFSLNLDLK
jgi:hypothetical protein